MFGLTEVVGSLMIVFVIVIFSHRLIKRKAGQTNQESQSTHDSE